MTYDLGRKTPRIKNQQIYFHGYGEYDSCVFRQSMPTSVQKVLENTHHENLTFTCFSSFDGHFSIDDLRFFSRAVFYDDLNSL